MNEEQKEIAILLDGNNFYKGLEKSGLFAKFDLNLFDYEFGIKCKGFAARTLTKSLIFGNLQ